MYLFPDFFGKQNPMDKPPKTTFLAPTHSSVIHSILSKKAGHK